MRFCRCCSTAAQMLTLRADCTTILYMQLEQEDLTRGRDKIVQVLLNRGADAKAQSEVYGNALHVA
jgi:hypothetical protein